MAKERGDEVTSNYLFLTNPNLLNFDHEITIKKRVLVAEKFSDQIYTSRIDQISYFKRKTLPVVRSFPDQYFVMNLEKFKGLKIPKIFLLGTTIDAKMVNTGKRALQLMKGVTMMVSNLSFLFSIFLALMMAGTAQAKPPIIGITLFPFNPAFLMILSERKLILAM